MKSVLLYDSQPVFVTGLAHLIRKAHPEVEILEAGSTNELNEIFAQKYPISAVVGIRSYAEGIEVFREIPKKIAVQVIYDDFSDIIKLKTTIGSIGGLVERKTGTEELLKCFESFLQDGKGYCSTTVNNLLQKFSKSDLSRLPERSESDSQSQRPWRLTKRENEIRDLLIKGKRITDIADLLEVRPSTVSTIKRKLFKKMDVTNLVQLVQRSGKT